MVSFLTATSHLIYLEMPITGLSRMAISKKLSNTNWMFYRGMYNKLLGHYIDLLDLNDRKFLLRFKDCFAVDGSIIRLNKTLENIFKSTCKSQAALKLNVKFSIVTSVATKLQVTEGKIHDNKFRYRGAIRGFGCGGGAGLWGAGGRESCGLLVDRGRRWWGVMALTDSCESDAGLTGHPWA